MSVFNQFKNLFGGSATEPRLSPAERKKHAFTRYLPAPSEATINMLQTVMQDKNAFRPAKGKSSDDVFSMAVSTLESPSSRLVVNLVVQEATGNPNARGTVTVAEVPDPDPREPLLQGKFMLWGYEGTDPHPVVPPPDKIVAGTVAAIAATSFDIESWKTQAKEAAARTTVWKIHHLLSVMVYPPKRPPQMPMWVWLQRIQIAAALVIAYVEQDWQKSQRRKALIGLALGPMDWTTGAALIALTELAQENERIAAELVEAIRRLIDNRPDKSGVCYEYTMACCGLRIPDLPADLKRKLQDMKSRFDELDL